MRILRDIFLAFIGVILIILACVFYYTPSNFSFELIPATQGKRFIITKPGGTVALKGYIGHKSHNTSLQISYTDFCVQISSKASTNSEVLEDCFDLGSAHWYGGPEQKYQYWLLEKSHFSDYSYVTKRDDNQGIAEPYWISSHGVYIHVKEDVPLFIDLNNKLKDHLCIIANNSIPYSNTTILFLNYTICIYENARVAHEHAIQDVLGKPSGYPDETMIRYPIWSTWARYKTNINESAVLQFANSILKHNFSNSQLEIDDNWEICYGSLTFNKSRFPDMKKLIDTLKAKGFRVTLWVHPFINLDCEPWYSEAFEKGYFVKNIEGNDKITWPKGNASIIDFTNSDATQWYLSRLQKIQEKIGIDSFKCDYGETNFLPESSVLSGKEQSNPSIYTKKYVNAVSKLGSMIEVRVGQRSQNLSMFVRMLDKDSRWDWNNGLKTLVTTLLVMNIAGYPFVLPDMIGGNGYRNQPSKELFIRWLQANVFMPSLQYSYVPWDFDYETVEIARKYTALHAEYAEKIIELFKKTTQNGSPVNPPIWWIDPTDKQALNIESEYLLGEDILVAPILEEGATSRDIYLPTGEWKDELRSQKISGPILLRDYAVALHELPYFTRYSS